MTPPTHAAAAVHQPPVADIDCAGKAEWLLHLQSRLRAAQVPPSLLLRRGQWPMQARPMHARLVAGGFAASLAVRSAAAGEDAGAANAGRFRSLIGIDALSFDAFVDAVEQVFASYGRLQDEDAVLLQPAIGQVRRAIVARGGAGAAVRSMSVAAVADSAAITRGDVACDTWHVERGCRDAAGLPAPLPRVLKLLDELEHHVRGGFEVELVDSGDTLWLLQLRPVELAPDRMPSLLRARARRDHDFACASDDGITLMGLMPDWNPAELLGEHPRPLALSLFSRLITDGRWWRARCAMGYASPARGRLLRPIAGRPYVDVEASLQSLLPAALPAGVRRALVAQALERLRGEPALHDRIEFELQPSGALLDLVPRLQCALGDAAVVTHAPAFVALTDAALQPPVLAAEIAAFAAATIDIEAGRSDATSTLAERLQAIGDHLALPFARAARRDFLAASLWHSALRIGAFEPARRLQLLAATPTGAGAALRGGCASRLRAGQFEITSPVHTLPGGAAGSEPARFTLRAHERVRLDRLLQSSGLPFDADGLVARTIAAAHAREVGKRALAAAVCDWLDAVSAWAETRGIDADTASWLDVDDLLDGADIDRLQQRADVARARHAEDALLPMPPLLTAAEDLHAVRQPARHAHWLGRGRIQAPVACIDARTRPLRVPIGAVVLVESCDPGFDWLFTRRPRALLTAWGGPHSHMALRCADAGCAAVLGLGPERLKRLAQAPRLLIDFDEQRISPLHAAAAE